jgi:hypothetical protein
MEWVEGERLRTASGSSEQHSWEGAGAHVAPGSNRGNKDDLALVEVSEGVRHVCESE